MQKIVSIIAYRRYEYLRRAFEALTRCDGIEGYTVLVHVDPGYPAVEELAKHYPFRRKEVVVNEWQLGCDANVFQAVNHAMQLSDYAVTFEDDIVPARDCLRFFEFVNERYRDDPTVFSGCAYHRPMPERKDWHRVWRNKFFTPWGWSTWRDRWVEAIKVWPGTAAAKGMAWDGAMNHIARGDRTQVHPFLARVQNIGARDGLHSPEDYRKAEQYNANWAGAVGVPDEEFFEDGVGAYTDLTGV